MYRVKHSSSVRIEPSTLGTHARTTGICNTVVEYASQIQMDAGSSPNGTNQCDEFVWALSCSQKGHKILILFTLCLSLDLENLLLVMCTLSISLVKVRMDG